MDTFHVINLDHRTTKYTELCSDFKNVTRVPAISGRDLSNEYINNINQNLPRALKHGEIGCFMSHVKLWEKCISSNMDYILVAEDDISPTANYSATGALDSFHRLREEQKDWDICYFSEKVDMMNDIKTMIYQYKMPEITYDQELIKTDDYEVIRPRCGLHMYAISRNGCKKMVKACKEILAPIDVQMWFTDTPVNCYCLVNNLVREKREYSDTYTDSLVSDVQDYMENMPTLKNKYGTNPMSSADKTHFRRLISRINNGSSGELSDLLKLQKKYPDWYQIQYFLAKTYVLSEHYDKGMYHYERACADNQLCYDTNLEFARLMMVNKEKSYKVVKQLLHCINIDKYKSEPYIIIINKLIMEQRNPFYILDFIDTALEYDKRNLQLVNFRAVICERLGYMNESLAAHQKCLEIDPSNSKLHFNVGIMILKSATRTGDAIPYFEKCLSIEPKFIPAYMNLIAYHKKMSNRQKVFEICQEGIKRTNHPAFYYEIGSVYIDEISFENAEKSLSHALKHIGNDNHMKCRILRELGRVSKYLKQFDKAQEYYNDIMSNRYTYFSSETDTNDFLNSYGQFLLLLGKYEEGYMYYNALYDKNNRHFTKPMWNDERDCHLILYNTNGMGDEFMFGRYIPEVCKRVKKCTLMLTDKTHHIFMASEVLNEIDNLTIIKDSQKATCHDYDYHADFLQLPEILEMFEPIPDNSYISLDDHPSNGIMGIIEKMGNGSDKKILINWRGNKQNSLESFREVPMDTIVEIVKQHPTVQWISVQKDVTKEEEKRLHEAGVLHISLDNGEDAFSDSISLMKEISMVISSDTSLVHLAGTFGIKTVAMLAHVPEWRWGLDGDTVPWYKTVRCVRQTNWNDWDSIVDKVGDVIREVL